jgi:hypothetical protein
MVIDSTAFAGLRQCQWAIIAIPRWRDSGSPHRHEDEIAATMPVGELYSRIFHVTAATNRANSDLEST